MVRYTAQCAKSLLHHIQRHARLGQTQYQFLLPSLKSNLEISRPKKLGSPGVGGIWRIQGGAGEAGLEEVEVERQTKVVQNGVHNRARDYENQRAAKRRKIDSEKELLPAYATKFSKEEIEAQGRLPKRKVAVMIGYSGSGYKGMQLNHNEKTIEGDLFSAFVAAGAISKANADDPKKSSLVRCARTDKGVHAAGNLISLKLVIEDSDIVLKINEQLTPQIRVWGIERTNGSFSAYQYCDSRIYEYLIPTHCFLPPHPKSFLSKQLVELAEEAGDLEGYLGRQKEVADFWSETDEQYLKPACEQLDPQIRDQVVKDFYEHTENAQHFADKSDEPNESALSNKIFAQTVDSGAVPDAVTEGQDPNAIIANESRTVEKSGGDRQVGPSSITPGVTSPESAVRHLKAAHIAAKKAYRIHPSRLARVRSCLGRYLGSHRFHNYTIDKTFKDPSAIRVMKSFTVSETPIIINNTEWLSLKVHGQSFMMHQIRKMVSMVALVIRCGCHEGRVQDSYSADRFNIPKAPSLGLLLERPVFDEYNKKLEEFGREKIDFGRYEKEMEEFKQREIYERIFREEERDNTFHSFFTALDHAKSAQLLYLSSVGMEAVRRDVSADAGREASEVGGDDEDEGNAGEEG